MGKLNAMGRVGNSGEPTDMFCASTRVQKLFDEQPFVRVNASYGSMDVHFRLWRAGRGRGDDV